MSKDTSNGRKLAGIRDLAFILLIALAALLAIWVMHVQRDKTGFNFAVVTLDGREIMRIDLADYKGPEEKLISLEKDFGVPVHFQLKDGAIRFYEVNCPDHLCEGFGFIKKEYESAICIPNRTVVVIYSREEVKQLKIVSN